MIHKYLCLYHFYLRIGSSAVSFSILIGKIFIFVWYAIPVMIATHVLCKNGARARGDKARSAENVGSSHMLFFEKTFDAAADTGTARF